MKRAFQAFRKQLAWIFGILLISWLCTPFADHLLGFGVGLTVSMYCGWMLARRIEKIGEHITIGKRLPSLGTVNRFAAAVLGCILLYEIEHHMTMAAFATGILGGYILLIVNIAYYTTYNKDANKAKAMHQE